MQVLCFYTHTYVHVSIYVYCMYTGIGGDVLVKENLKPSTCLYNRKFQYTFSLAVLQLHSF